MNRGVDRGATVGPSLLGALMYPQKWRVWNMMGARRRNGGWNQTSLRPSGRRPSTRPSHERMRRMQQRLRSGKSYYLGGMFHE